MITKELINNIREEIAERIETEQEDVFAHISAHPTSKLDGFPAVIVMLSQNDVSFASTGSNDARKITLTFSLNCYFPATKEADQLKAEEAMGEAVSELLRIFCVKKPLNTVDLAKVGVTPWEDQSVGDAVYRSAQVLLTVSLYVDIA